MMNFIHGDTINLEDLIQGCYEGHVITLHPISPH